MKNFWNDLPKPFFVLAPMADVTDVAFREFIARTGKPDVLYTEFVACKGLLSDLGRKALVRDLFYTETQRPIVAQVFGSDPEDFLWCAQFVRELGFDGIDVNMGCPDKKVEKQGAGAALIQDPARARAIIRALKEGAGDIPVAVKTRIGYNMIETEAWIGELLKERPAALIVHLRTRKEMSKVLAHWEEMPKIVEMARGTGTVIIGNGDVTNREEGERRVKETGCDGIMIGRGIFGNPWVFTRNVPVRRSALLRASVLDAVQQYGLLRSSFVPRISSEQKRFESMLSKADIGRVEKKVVLNTDSQMFKADSDNRLRALIALIVFFDITWGETKNYDILKKHYASYVRGFSGAKELRIQLMETKSCKDAKKLLEHSIN